MVEHRRAETVAAPLDGGMHRLHLAVRRVELAERTDGDELPVGTGTEERHRGVVEAFTVERVHMSGRRDFVGEVEVAGDKCADVVAARILFRYLASHEHSLSAASVATP